jgi:hypothetical protein
VFVVICLIGEAIMDALKMIVALPIVFSFIDVTENNYKFILVVVLSLKEIGNPKM